MKLTYRSTMTAGFIGYFTQATTINFLPLLYLTFRNTYGFSLTQISALIAICFCVQLAADAATVKFPTFFKPRATALLAHILSAIGIAGYSFLPRILPPYIGLVIAVILSSTGSGLVEVMITPIIEACPSPKKSSNMSLLHSFYCWGQATVILLSTLFFSVFGIENWEILALLWSLVPVTGAILFAIVPIYPVAGTEKDTATKAHYKNKLFWLLVVMMLCAGASEMTMSQWASSFAESALGVRKAVGDLIGPCLFAVLQGTMRVLYARLGSKVRLEIFMSISAVICVVAYLLAALAPDPMISLIGCALCGCGVGIMWPGSVSQAALVLPEGGLSMFAFLALAGDVGCLIGPSLAGTIADSFGGNIRISFGFSLIYPAALLAALLILGKHLKTKGQGQKENGTCDSAK